MRTLIRSLGVGLALATGLFVGCGGGGGSAAVVPASTTISGSAVKGPVNGATVTARAVSSGAVLGTTTTSPTGTYSFTISHSGDVVIEVQGGTYADEATGVTTPLNQLKAYVTAGSGAKTVHVTPLTYLAYGYAGGTRAGFDTALTNLATQFGLGSINLLTTLPEVTGTVNDYGRVLRGISKYVQNQGLANFDVFMNQALTSGTFTSLQTNFTSAYNAINPGQELTFAFNGSGITVAGTGAGGGSGTCGVALSGTVLSPGSGVPISFGGNYCVTGIAAGSCTNGNSSLTSAIPLGVGATNVTYTTSTSCAVGAITINLAS